MKTKKSLVYVSGFFLVLFLFSLVSSESITVFEGELVLNNTDQLIEIFPFIENFTALKVSAKNEHTSSCSVYINLGYIKTGANKDMFTGSKSKPYPKNSLNELSNSGWKTPLGTANTEALIKTTKACSGKITLQKITTDGVLLCDPERIINSSKILEDFSNGDGKMNTTHKINRSVTECRNEIIEYVERKNEPSCEDIYFFNYNQSINLAVPVITSLPSKCVFGTPCERNITFEIDSSVDVVHYDIIWTYNYVDGHSKTVCTWNDPATFFEHNLRTTNTEAPLTIRDDNTAVIKNVSIRIAVFNGTEISNFSAPSYITPIYPCVSGCDRISSTQEIEDNDPTNYLLCERIGNSQCFNWTKKSCFSESDRTKMFFNKIVGIGECVNNGIYQCEGFCNFSMISDTKATLIEEGSCGLNSFNIGCYKCDINYTYDYNNGYCVSNDCISGTNSCKAKGGVCNKSESYGNAHSATFDCCNPGISCFICNENHHLRDGICVSDFCSGGNLPLDYSGVIKGANRTNNTLISLTWNYTDSLNPGICEWTCNSSTHTKETGENGIIICKEREPFNCTLEGGICSRLAVPNAQLNSLGVCLNEDGDTESGQCRTCNEIYRRSDDNLSCVRKTCEEMGKVDNGIKCVNGLSNCNQGCIADNNRGISFCVVKGTRLLVEGKTFFCTNISSEYKFLESLGEGKNCTNNWECNSNFCHYNLTSEDSKCLTIQELSGFREMFANLVCFIKYLNDPEGRKECTEEEALNHVRNQLT